ncbi:MAG: SpoIID/LytB domain-containing protein [Planctomycetes bacterium]|nr:SpoIID/LytB domain-containing protein [Planctomycetota bacterium]
MLLLLLLAVEEPPTVRVLLQDAQKSVTIECAGPVDLRNPYLPKPILQFGRLVATRIDLADGKFRLLDRLFDESRLTFEARQEPFKLGARSYPQRLHLFREKDSFKVVNEVDIETYVLGVVGAEIGAGSPVEAQMAQAVAARSYVAAGLEGFPNPGPSRAPWDVHDDTRSQVYVGVPAKSSSVERAVKATSGLMVLYKGRIVRTFFSSACGGHTMGLKEWTGAAEIPPLSGVPCGFCGGVGAWTRRFTLEDIGAKFKSRTGGKPALRFSVEKASPSGRPAGLLIETSGAKVQVTAKEADAALDLPTSMYAVTQGADGVTLSGAGNGHGVGLCQWGAINMAKKGRKYEQILAHYYPQGDLKPGYVRK